MDRVNKIKNQNTSVEEIINKEENAEFIKEKLKDKKDVSIKKQRLVFKIIQENEDYKDMD